MLRSFFGCSPTAGLTFDIDPDQTTQCFSRVLDMITPSMPMIFALDHLDDDDKTKP